MKTERRGWIFDLLLIGVLLGAAYFRVLGLNWDRNQHLHPDERFLTMVESAMQPAESFAQYFDTATSPLNPHNVGYGFFVYGTLPMIVTRYIAEWLGQVGYDQVHMVGRQLSVIADLGVIFLLYLIAGRLYGRRVGLLAAAFSSLTVMQIQQSHFFTVDNPANLFLFLAILFAVLITDAKDTSIDDGPLTMTKPAAQPADESSMVDGPSSTVIAPSYTGSRISDILRDRLLWLSLGFGLALGMAVASKLNAAPMAILLPAAFAIRHLRLYQPQTDDREPSTARDHPPTTDDWLLVAGYLLAGAFAAALAFRIFQPYAFSGIGLNPAWLNNIRELAAQSSGDADVPFALQWARRSHLYSFENLMKWGIGLPLGILGWIGFAWMGWKILKGEWKHALLWGWMAVYFVWQSMAFNPTMRYQLPVYPLLCMMAAWAVFELARSNSAIIRRGAYAVAALVLLATLGWAYAFTRIYTRPHTRVAATEWIYQNLPGPINLEIDTEEGRIQQPLPFSYGASIQAGTPHVTPFTVHATGELTEVYLPHVLAAGSAPQTLDVAIATSPDSPPGEALGRASAIVLFSDGSDPRGQSYTLTLDRAVPVSTGETYFLVLLLSTSDLSTGGITLAGAAPANESSWDDGLPLRTAHYDGFGGLYNGGLNLELYWADNADKVARFESMLSQGDYIFITSNRQWASIPRVPERYPLTAEYYRLLIGCPPEKDVIWCYNVARPGQFQGKLGFDLVQVFESYPTLDLPGALHWEFNDQFAEEAFTVYDHPKVLIFQKNASFDSRAVRSQLSRVDLSRVVHLTPKQASNYEEKDLMLPADRLAGQRAGGTWSDLFDYDWPQNKYPILGLVVWYLFIFVLGLVAYPLARLALPGLGPYAYPLGRVVGLVLVAYLAWLAGSLGMPYTRAGIGAAFGLIALAGVAAASFGRVDLRAEWASHRRFFLIVELLFLLFFVFDLLIRLGNPDLWHPYKGGERPMDFSYFNAVIKSNTFPPYDPWFAGGYINYYYYGFVLVGTPVKLLGIVPTLAYNMILPTLFAMVAIGAFTVTWNLMTPGPSTIDDGPSSGENHGPRSMVPGPLIPAIAAAVMMVVLGNLGTLQMMFQGFQRMAAPGGVIDGADIVQRWIWAVQGFVSSFKGNTLPFGTGDWYWNPSRVLPPGPGNEITEFPFFTFLYSDLHAHMIVMPLALFLIAWAVSLVKTRARLSRLEWGVTIAAAALFVGALRPTNTWDLYTYYALAAVALLYTIWRYGPWKFPAGLSDRAIRFGLGILAAGLLYTLASWLYSPFTQWFSQAYNSLDPWSASRTPLFSYFTHWGLFLFIIAFWLVWETRQWMASTPVSSLGKLKPYQLLIEGVLAGVIVLLVYFAVKRVTIAWVALPMAVWAGVLLLRPGQPDAKRAALFLIGTALTLTMGVELYTVRGDIGRQNTIFKLYLQAWAMLSVSAAAALGWLLPHVESWRPRWRSLFQVGLAFLLMGTSLYTITATMEKINDRMAPDAPHVLDSMTYMNHAQHWDGATMDLSQDYRAIRWMQDNVQGSPVIVEANVTEYRWGTRFTIYTGLPGVVGWNFHQRQQRALLPPNLVTDRVDQVVAFYNTTDINQAREFLQKYDVSYIIVGQMERIHFPTGIAKFEQYDGQYWRAVYEDGDTAIYEVLR